MDFRLKIRKKDLPDHLQCYKYKRKTACGMPQAVSLFRDLSCSDGGRARVRKKGKQGILLGAVLLGIFFLDLMLLWEKGPGQEKQAEGEAVPREMTRISVLKNVWIMELAQDMITIFYDGKRQVFSLSKDCIWNGAIKGNNKADIVLTGLKVTQVNVLEENLDRIRVLIRNSNYESLFHEKLEISGEQGLILQCLRGTKWQESQLEKGELLFLDLESALWHEGVQCIRVLPKALNGSLEVKNLERSEGPPKYQGELEICLLEEGMAMVNVLPLEEYLCQVIPSEMPASYPEEALKAQAICARTYACGKMVHAAYPDLGAHLDDSAMFQVYANLPAKERTTLAVKATRGQVLWQQDGALAETYYYSTSCGRGTDEKAWGGEEESRDYLRGKLIGRQELDEWLGGKKLPVGEAEEPEFLRESNEDDYEAGEPWYRWTYEVRAIDVEHFKKCLETYAEDRREEAGTITSVSDLIVTERAEGGAAVCLLARTDQGEFRVRGEYGIRATLCDGVSSCLLANGKETICSSLIPSSFFLMETSKMEENVVGYTIIGGGLGHGIGMSQNGAKAMAQEGLTAEEILGFFFQGCEIATVGDA